jgi:hypothetical protein
MSTTTNVETTGTLTTLIISLLARMFLGITNGNVALARAAAIETVNDYRAKNSMGLIAVAQIIAFGLASVGSLSLAMEDNIPAPMALRLRANANACNRAADRSQRTLEASNLLEKTREAEENDAFQDAIFADPDPDPEPEVFLTPEAERLLAAEAQARLHNNPVGRTPTQDQVPSPVQPPVQPPVQAQASTSNPTLAKPTSNQQAWAVAMQREAAKINASIPHLPPAQRQAASLRASALSTTALSILGAAALPDHGTRQA